MGQGLITTELIGDLPAAAAKHWGARLALVFGQRHWSYAEFNDEVNRLAASLVACGIRKGDRVAVWLNNCPEAEFLFFAIVKVGAIAVPLNTRYRTTDLAYTLRQSGSVMIIAASQSGPVSYDKLLAEALGKIVPLSDSQLQTAAAPQLRRIVIMGQSKIPGATRWEDFQSSGNNESWSEAQVAIDAADPAVMAYTSGTTGNPKGVLLNHSVMRLCYDRSIITAMHSGDVQLTYLPLFHCYALSYCVIMSFMCGAHQVLMEAFDADIGLRLIEEKRVSVVHGFDTHFNDFLQAQKQSRRDISSLRFGTLTVGPEASVALAREVQDKLCPTLSGYGMTELWGGVTITPLDASIEQRCEASGLPQPGVELRVVDIETRLPVANGVKGNIQVHSYSRMVAYHEDPDATNALMDKNGWIDSGDMGVLGEDGHIRYLGRKKDMLKVGGENVSPMEVEALICQMPGVLSVAVVGYRHERLQEAPAAFVVSGPEGPNSEQAVIGFCRGKLASFKIPSRVVFVDQLPMTATGKIQKELLRKRLAESDTA